MQSRQAVRERPDRSPKTPRSQTCVHSQRRETPCPPPPKRPTARSRRPSRGRVGTSPARRGTRSPPHSSTDQRRRATPPPMSTAPTRANPAPRSPCSATTRRAPSARTRGSACGSPGWEGAHPPARPLRATRLAPEAARAAPTRSVAVSQMPRTRRTARSESTRRYLQAGPPPSHNRRPTERRSAIQARGGTHRAARANEPSEDRSRRCRQRPDGSR